MSAARIRFCDGPYDGRVIWWSPARPPALYFQRCEDGRWRTYTYRRTTGGTYRWQPDGVAHTPESDPVPHDVTHA